MLAHHRRRNKTSTYFMFPGALCNEGRNTCTPLYPPSPSLGPSGICTEAQDTSGVPERDLADTGG